MIVHAHLLGVCDWFFSAYVLAATVRGGDLAPLGFQSTVISNIGDIWESFKISSIHRRKERRNGKSTKAIFLISRKRGEGFCRGGGCPTEWLRVWVIGWRAVGLMGWCAWDGVTMLLCGCREVSLGM